MRRIKNPKWSVGLGLFIQAFYGLYFSPVYLRTSQKHEIERGSNSSTYWLILELLWRDYFKFLAIKDGYKIFNSSGLSFNHSNLTSSQTQKKDLELFKQAETMDLFINANIKELLATGWMSNLGRQNVASYLIHDLGINCIEGAKFFEEYFINYDPTSSYSNWRCVAGAGEASKPGKVFNIPKQTSIYDTKGTYRKLWNT